MKNLVTITAMLLLSTLLTKAQDTTKHKSQPDSLIKAIPFGYGKHAGYIYTIGGRLQTPDDIRMKLLAYAPSANEFRAAKSNLTWSFISLGGVAVFSTAALIDFKNNDKYAGATTGIVNGQPAFIYQQHNKTGAYILTGLATGFLIAEITTLINGAKHGRKAVKLYNQRFE